MKRVYLDYAASTPVRKEILRAMLPYFNQQYGNAGSLHFFGQKSIQAIDEARQKIALALNANFQEIIFTSGATEANNLALRGVITSYLHQKQNIISSSPKIIISSIEHESILQTALNLKQEGIETIFLPVDKKGVVNLKKLEELLDENVILISVMSINNEIGTLEPIEKISKIIHQFKQTKKEKIYPLFHSDAAQALMYFKCNVKKLGVDLMTISGQKVFGPKGIGALYIKKEIQENKIISSLITGGFQEFGLRGGTENTPLIFGLGKAVELSQKELNQNFKYVESIKKYFWKGLKKIYPQAFINGSSSAPHILNVCLPNESSFDFLTALDINGIAASYGSACQARFYEPSYVLQALGLDEKTVRSSMRFSFGITTKKEEINFAIKTIKLLKNKMGA
jgi:cysteine desulfurase